MKLTDLPPFPRKKILRVVIETPKGSRNKIDYDPELKVFALAKVLPQGMVFPYDFGFIPQTEGEDGDPLDILVLLAEPVHPGCVVECKLIGAILGRQGRKGEKLARNDRFIAVSQAVCEYADMDEPGDLPEGMLRQLEEFFVTYNRLEGKIFEILGVKGPKAALQLIKARQKKP